MNNKELSYLMNSQIFVNYEMAAHIIFVVVIIRSSLESLRQWIWYSNEIELKKAKSTNKNTKN